MTKRFGTSETRPTLLCASAFLCALAVVAPKSASAFERGGAMMGSTVQQQPNFGGESRVSAARQPAFSPQFAHSDAQRNEAAEPEGRLRLRPMAFQGGY